LERLRIDGICVNCDLGKELVEQPKEFRITSAESLLQKG